MNVVRVVGLALLLAALSGPGCGGGAGGGTPAPSNDASLSSLTISAGTIVPAFTPATLNYTAGPGAIGTSITVTPTTTSAAATMVLNGNGAASGTPVVVATPEGPTQVQIVVTAQDGATQRIYVVNITAASHNAQLSALATSHGTLSPAFAAGVTAYTTGVGALLASTTVTPTAANAGATITVNGQPVGSGTPSQALALSLGAPTPVNVSLTAADGVTQLSYAIVITRAAAAGQQAFLKASNAESDDEFGLNVALSGETLVVGAYREDSNGTGGPSNNSLSNSGAAYVFVRSGTTWSEQAYLKASNPGDSDFFGHTLAISGDTLVVSAWGEDASAAGGQADNSAPDAGAVYVFVRSGTTWTQQAYLKASNAEANDHFGYAVALAGDTLVVGARQEDGNGTGGPSDNSAVDSGAAYVFVRSGTTWSQQAYLKASNAGAGDSFGWSVGLSGETIVVGAKSEDSSAVGGQADNSAGDAGAAYVFVRSGTTWTQQAYLKASNADAADQFGHSVSISGETLAVSAHYEASGPGMGPTDNSAPNAGAVYVFVRSGATWSQQAFLKASNVGDGDDFGWSIALSGDAIVVGATDEDSSAAGGPSDNSVTNAGAAYVFSRSGTTWTQTSFLKAANAEDNDVFGWWVALDGETAVVGAIYEDSSPAGGPGDNSAAHAGAVYVYR